jgi:alkyl hydroperoxide reductase subunit AhpF
VRDAEQVEKYGVDKIPATVVLQDGPQPKDFGIRLYGIPSGYEFSSFIHDILLASRGNPDLKPKTLDALGRLDRRVQIQVYVTPT